MSSRRFFEVLGSSLVYESRESIFIKLSIVTKIVYIILTSITAFISDKFLPLIILLSINIGLSMIDRAMPKKIVMMLKGLSLFIAMIFLFNVITTFLLGETDLIDVILHQVLATIRILAVVPPLLIFISSTTPLQIIQFISRLGVRYDRLYPFVIAYRFIPLIFQEMKNIYDAQRSRGVELEQGGIINKLKGSASVVVPMIVCSTIRARDLAEALMIRGFGYKEKRTFYRTLTFTRLDILFIFMVLITHVFVLVITRLSYINFL
ncbi:MAG: energy-coupling factor transporter transmembrane component T [Ignisphaera sp.]